MDADQQLFDLLRDIRNSQIANAEAMGGLKASLDALAGDHGRVTELESAQTRNFWISVAIAPVLAAMHAIARKAGVNI